MSRWAVSFRPGSATSSPWMARGLVRTGCPAEGKATPGRQDTAAHRSPHGRLGRASPRWEKNLFLASRLLSPSPVKRERGWGEGVSGHVEVGAGSPGGRSRTLTPNGSAAGRERSGQDGENRV